MSDVKHQCEDHTRFTIWRYPIGNAYAWSFECDCGRDDCWQHSLPSAEHALAALNEHINTPAGSPVAGGGETP